MSLISIGQPTLQSNESEEIRSQIENNFNHANHANYLHYVLKHCNSKKTYETSFQSKLAEIEKKTGKPVPLDSKRVNSWTPMHVGAIVNNVEGVKHLLKLGASSGVDDFGKTPYDYCIMFAHHDLALILEKKSKLELYSEENHGVVNTLLTTYGVKLPDSPFEYKAKTHDFAVEIKKLLFSKPCDSSQDGLEIRHLTDNMKTIAEIEGFVLKFTHLNLFPRDHFILEPNGFKLPMYSKRVTKAIDCKHSYELIHDSSPTDYAYKALATTGGAIRGKVHANLEFNEQFGLQEFNMLPFYLEGGNYFILSNSKGSKKILMGKDVLLMTLNHLDLEGIFKKFEKILFGYAKKFTETLSEKDIKTVLEEMYPQGLLKQSVNYPKGLISKDERLEIIADRVAASEFGEEFNEKSYLNKAISSGYFKPMKLTSKMVEDARELAANYLAQKEVTKDIIAKSFSISKSDLCLITQLDYHLDVFIHSGPCGSVFVQDYEMVKQLLENIKNNAKSLGLTSIDMKMLEQYYSTACKFAQQFKPKQKKVVEELKEAGFIVIPTPAIFYDVCPRPFFGETLNQDMKNINFLNAISGWSSKTNRTYWITAGATSGDRLGKILMESFQQFLESYQKDIKVYFVGNDPKNPKDYSEAMKFVNEPEASAGLHCMSMELETKSTFR